MQFSKLLTAGLLALTLAGAVQGGEIRMAISMTGDKRIGYEMPAEVTDVRGWLIETLNDYNSKHGHDDEATGGNGYIDDGSPIWKALKKVFFLVTSSSLRYQLEEAISLGGHDEDVWFVTHFRGAGSPKVPRHVHDEAGNRRAIVIDVRYLVYNKAKLDYFQEVLVHESAHAGDEGLGCHGEGYYGAGGKHFGFDIVSPAAGMGEGWADFVAARDHEASNISKAIRAGIIPSLVWKPTGDERTWIKLPLQSWTVADLISNEIFVGIVLHKLWQYEGEEMAPLVEAFRSSAAGQCRSLPEFLAAYSRGNSNRQAMILSIFDELTDDRIYHSAIYPTLEGRLPKFRGREIEEDRVARDRYVDGEGSEDQGYEILLAGSEDEDPAEEGTTPGHAAVEAASTLLGFGL